MVDDRMEEETPYCLKCHGVPDDPAEMAYEDDGGQGLCADCERKLISLGLDPFSFMKGMMAA